MNFREEFNIRARGMVWSQSSEKLKMYFKYALIRLESIDNFFIPNQLLPPKTLEQRVYRLELGYFGIGMPSGIPSNIVTRASKELKSNECVNDHLIGATEIGKNIHQAFKEKNYDTDWMVNKWLFENLYLWGTVKVTKEEHKSCNILRNSDHTVEQKVRFEHYLNVSEVV